MRNKFIIGIDLGGTFVKIGLLNPNMKMLEKESISTKKYSNRLSLLKEMVRQVNELLDKRNIRKNEVLGIGIGVPGPVDVNKGLVHFLPNIPGWKNFPLKRWMQETAGIKTFIDNDVNVITLGEWKLGAGRGSEDMICITLGTGVGGGLILDGKMYRGSSFLAGEIGHMPINEHGSKCSCTGRGCLEKYVGNRNILAIARSKVSPHITLEGLSKLSKQGNKKAIKVWQDVGEKVGVVLSGVVNLLNPKKIVVGGGVSNAGKVLFDSINKTVKSRAMPNHSRAVKILKAQLGSDAGILGAAILVKENLQKKL